VPVRARQYDPALGRFLQREPVPPKITDPYVAAYVYVNNLPTVFIDPSGMTKIFGLDLGDVANVVGTVAAGVAVVSAGVALVVATGGTAAAFAGIAGGISAGAGAVNTVDTCIDEEVGSACGTSFLQGAAGVLTAGLSRSAGPLASYVLAVGGAVNSLASLDAPSFLCSGPGYVSPSSYPLGYVYK